MVSKEMRFMNCDQEIFCSYFLLFPHFFFKNVTNHGLFLWNKTSELQVKLVAFSYSHFHHCNRCYQFNKPPPLHTMNPSYHLSMSNNLTENSKLTLITTLIVVKQKNVAY